MKRRTIQRGVATMSGLVALAVVGVTLLVLTQTIIREQRDEARRFQVLQARLLASDLERLASQKSESVPDDFSLTVSRSELGSISDLHVGYKTTEKDGRPVAEITVQTTDPELPSRLKYSVRKLVALPEAHE